MFECFLDSDRFWYILPQIKKDPFFKIKGSSTLRKTASFYSNDINAYIDTSDGVNEDFGTQEYCGRIKAVIRECKGKPFIFFKSFYSSKSSSKIEKIAKENNGQVIPFFFWSTQRSYKDIYFKKTKVTNLSKNKTPESDVGLFFNPDCYFYPKPNACDKDIAWEDFKHFNFGCGDNTGKYKVETRKNILEKFKSSNLNIDFSKKLDYNSYIQRSMNCKLCFCPPGIGEYTQRMFDYGLLNIPILIRKTTYDFGISWKNYIPEVDFENKNWENQVQDIIINIDEYKKLQKEYFNNTLSPENIFKFFKKKLIEQ